MKSVILLLLILMQINKRSEISSCGQLQTHLVPSLSNANQTHRWPWHVAVFHKYNESTSIYQCGGTLISKNSILTAAHCVMIDAKNISVLLGKFIVDASESTASMIRVTKKKLHPDYDSDSLENDIAVITLSINATYNSYVQPICLWKADNTDLSEVVGKWGTVVGWGVKEDGAQSKIILEASMPVVDHLTCLFSNREVFGKALTRTNYCAGRQDGASVCQGDSGSSMTFKMENGLYYIRGIVSSSATKINHNTQEFECDTMQYAVFTDVAPFLSWIKDTAKIIDCQINVRCTIEWDGACIVDVNVTGFSPECKVIFGDVSNAAVTELRILGESDSVPDLSHAMTKFGNLVSLRLVNIKLQFVNRARLSAFRQITSLELYDNKISRFNPGTFDDLNNLETFDISENLLSDIHPNLFSKFEHLKELFLGDNKLESLPSSLFQNNKDLWRIDISYNLLTELPSDLFTHLENLKWIFLNRNSLESLPSSLFQNNGKLTKINVSHNQLKEVHSDLLKDIENLEWISFSGNKLESLPSFQNNKKIKVLDVSYNQLKEIDSDILEVLVDLEIFDCNQNNLESLPSSLFQNNGKLTMIMLRNNKIKKIETNFFNMPLLLTLDLSENVCIDKRCNVQAFCGSSSLNEMNDNIRRNCTDNRFMKELLLEMESF